MLLRKGSRKSCHVRSVAPNFFTAETPLRKWAVTCVFLSSPSIAAFCPEPVSFHSPNPLGMSPPVPYQEAARSSFCCHRVFGSNIAPEAELMLLSDLAEVPGPRAARQPHLSCSSLWPSSCLSKEVLSSHQKELQEQRPLEDPCENSPAESKGWENRVHVPPALKPHSISSFSPHPITLAPKRTGALSNRPQSLLGGRRAMKTKAYRRPWEQRSTQYPSKVKWCSFRITKCERAWSRRGERKFGKKVSILLLEMCAGRQQEMQKSSFSSLALFANHKYSFSCTAGSLMRGKKQVLCSANHFFKKQKSLRCQHYSNLRSPKSTSFHFGNEGSLQFSDLDILKS